MFPSLGLFKNLSCPEKSNCKRPQCIFSHRPDVLETPVVSIPVVASTSSPSASPLASSSSALQSTVPAKRPGPSDGAQPPSTPKGSPVASGEPPRKLQKVGTIQRPLAVPTAQVTSTGAPILKVNAAQSQVPIPVRQTMLKMLYDHFVVLYESILPTNPMLASEHALKQEDEIYRSSSKAIYRNAVKSSIASLKNRPRPDSISHPSVGTQEDLAKRAEAEKSIKALRLTKANLEPLVLSVEDMKKWGYVVEIPDGPGGDRPSAEGKIQKCDRCGQQFVVKRREHADECIHHWGRPYSKSISGDKSRVYSCCGKPSSSEGCSRGPHVFYETKPEDLHARHEFTRSRIPRSSESAGSEGNGASSTALDAVALDCEMVYTTGGMRVARVSVVDRDGDKVFDELVRMDDGVEVIDYNTRFSGITPEEHSKAVLPLTAIRRALDSLIDCNTIIIGHALENDLKTLRMIHHRCVDTAVLFAHPTPGFRHALRHLVKEHLGKVIQAGGGTVGHSSLEDAIATLDLVRHYMKNKKPKPKPLFGPVVVPP